MANTFINTIKSAGYVTGLYTNKDFGNKYFSEDVINSNNLWVAQYASKNTYGRAYDMWQYTENGSIAGVSGNVDLNYTCLIPEGVSINTGGNNSNNNDNVNDGNSGNDNNDNINDGNSGNDNNGNVNDGNSNNDNNNTENKPSVPTEKGVTTANLNLRMEASTSSKIITTIPKGKTIEIVEKLNSGWYKVNYSGKTGYVSSKYVSMNGSNNNTNTNKPSTTSQKGVTTANLNLRVQASTSSKIITTIPKGKTIEIVDKSKTGWYKVNYSGKTGYVSSKYVRL